MALDLAIPHLNILISLFLVNLLVVMLLFRLFTGSLRNFIKYYLSYLTWSFGITFFLSILIINGIITIALTGIWFIILSLIMGILPFFISSYLIGLTKAKPKYIKFLGNLALELAVVIYLVILVVNFAISNMNLIPVETGSTSDIGSWAGNWFTGIGSTTQTLLIVLVVIVIISLLIGKGEKK